VGSNPSDERVIVGTEFPQAPQFEYGEIPGWLEADDVFFAQGVNVRRACVIASLVPRQNVKGENLDRILCLCHEISVQ
jgi:hypothetical protein